MEMLRRVCHVIRDKRLGSRDSEEDDHGGGGWGTRKGGLSGRKWQGGVGAVGGGCDIYCRK